MPEKDLLRAVEATVTHHEPDWGALALRSHRRRWVARGAAVVGMTTAAAVLWLAVAPAATPRFEDQVEAFVALVWAD